MSCTGTTIVRSSRLSLGGAAIVTGRAPPRKDATSSGGRTVAEQPDPLCRGGLVGEAQRVKTLQ